MSEERIVAGHRRAGDTGPRAGTGATKSCGASDAATIFAGGCGTFDDGELALSPRENQQPGRRRPGTRRQRPGKQAPEKRVVDLPEEEVVVDDKELGPEADDDHADVQILQAGQRLDRAIEQTSDNIDVAVDSFVARMSATEPSALGEVIRSVLAAVLPKLLGSVLTAGFGPLGNLVGAAIGKAADAIGKSEAVGGAAAAFAVETKRLFTEQLAALRSGLSQAEELTMAWFRTIDDLPQRRSLLAALDESSRNASASVPSVSHIETDLAVRWATHPAHGARGLTDGVPNGRILIDIDTEASGEGFTFSLDHVSLFVAERGEQVLPMIRRRVATAGLYNAGLPVDLVFARPHVVGGWAHTTLRMRSARVPERVPPMFPRELACWTALVANAGLWAKIDATAASSLEVGG